MKNLAKRYKRKFSEKLIQMVQYLLNYGVIESPHFCKVIEHIVKKVIKHMVEKFKQNNNVVSPIPKFSP